MDKISKRIQSNEYAKTHLKECVQELLEWQETTILKSDGHVRILAGLCQEWADDSEDSYSLTIAESIIKKQAFLFIAEN